MDEGNRTGSDEEGVEGSARRKGSSFFLPSGITDFEDEHTTDEERREGEGGRRERGGERGSPYSWPNPPTYEESKRVSVGEISNKVWSFNMKDDKNKRSSQTFLPVRTPAPGTPDQGDTNSTNVVQEDVKNMVFRVERAGSESSYIYTFGPRIHIPASHPLADPASNNHSDNVRSLSLSPWKVRHQANNKDATSTPSTPDTLSTPSSPSSSGERRTERSGTVSPVISIARRSQTEHTPTPTAQPRPLSSPPNMLTPMTDDVVYEEQHQLHLQQQHHHQQQQQQVQQQQLPQQQQQPQQRSTPAFASTTQHTYSSAQTYTPTTSQPYAPTTSQPFTPTTSQPFTPTTSLPYTPTTTQPYTPISQQTYITQPTYVPPQTYSTPQPAPHQRVISHPPPLPQQQMYNNNKPLQSALPPAYGQPPSPTSRSSRNRQNSNSYPTPVPYVISPAQQPPIPVTPIYRPLFQQTTRRQQVPVNMMPANAAPVPYWSGNWSYAVPQQSNVPAGQYMRDNRGGGDRKFAKNSPKNVAKKNRAATTGSSNSSNNNYPGAVAGVEKTVWKVKNRANSGANNSSAAAAMKGPQIRTTDRSGNVLTAKKDEVEYKQIKLLRRDDPKSQIYLEGLQNTSNVVSEDNEYEEEEDEESDSAYDREDTTQYGYDGDDGDDDDAPGARSTTQSGNNAYYKQTGEGGGSNNNNNTHNNSNNRGSDRRPQQHQRQHRISAHRSPPPMRVASSIITFKKPATNIPRIEEPQYHTENINKPEAALIPSSDTEVEESKPMHPAYRFISVFIIGIGLICALAFTILSLLMRIHRIAFISGVSVSTLLTVLGVYAFPLLVSILTSTVTWGPQFLWFVFLTWFCFVSGPPSPMLSSPNTSSLYIRLLVMVFVIELAYDGDFMLRSSGGERIVLAAVLLSLKVGRSIITTIHLFVFALAYVAGSNLFVQWIILLSVLLVAGHYRALASTISFPSSTTLRKSLALRRVRRTRDVM